MNRLFRLYNKKAHGVWMVAPDEEQARQMTLKIGHVRKLENIIDCDDQTDFYLDQPSGPSLKECLDQDDLVGVAAMRIHVESFAELQAKLKKGPPFPKSEPGTWEVHSLGAQ